MNTKKRFDLISAYLFLSAGLMGILVFFCGFFFQSLIELLSHLIFYLVALFLGILNIHLSQNKRYNPSDKPPSLKICLIFSSLLLCFGIFILTLPFWLFSDIYFCLLLISPEILILGHGFLFLYELM
ncbi:MAG: hypothetical protein ACFFD2_03880 [Promethearchaeota archaeon]